mmetsp:Transcript_2287/g.3673  ORF Transcript_2287/g.3673 Transcript_2287/m.3673 type:complete len:261 (-) Transcript_2287:766-1548(-)
MVVIGPMHHNLIEEALEKSCDKSAELLKCFDVDNGCTGEVPTPPEETNACNLKDMCLMNVKKEGGCICKTEKHQECDCSKGTLGMVIGFWKLIMIVIGAAGCFLAFIVAAAALTATFTKSGVYIWSTCSGCLTLVFGAIGAAFILIALVVTMDFDQPMLNLLKDCEGELLKDIKSEDTVGKCSVTSICDLVEFLKGKAQVLGFGLGIPFFVSGGMMYFGCWACCCCKSHFIEILPELDNDPSAAPDDGDKEKLQAGVLTQ